MSRMGEHAVEHFEPIMTPIYPMDATNEIAKALAAAQVDMDNPKMTGRNPFFKTTANPDGSPFATLADTRNAAIPTLAKHGIGVTQNLETASDGRAIVCTTTLWHASGQRLTFGPLVVPASKADAQGIGSAITYARRYSLMAAVGIVGEADDDGNAAVGKPVEAPKKGIGVHSPLGDVAIDDRAVKYADAFKEALDGGDVQSVAADLREEEGHEELYRAVWSLLDSKTRSAIKRVLAEKAAA